MRHRDDISSAGRGSRWLALTSVGLMLLSAVVLGVVLHARMSSTAERSVDVAQSRREGTPRAGEGAALVRSRREGTPGWRNVLAGLDRVRARAYAELDPRLLRRVYTPDSWALRADRALLRRYRDRGLRVDGLRMRVEALRVRSRTRDRVVLHVAEEVASGVVRGEGAARRRLPGDDVDRRTLTLRRVEGGGWRIAAVRPAVR